VALIESLLRHGRASTTSGLMLLGRAQVRQSLSVEVVLQAEQSRQKASSSSSSTLGAGLHTACCCCLHSGDASLGVISSSPGKRRGDTKES
jgi:hypothetical protein